MRVSTATALLALASAASYSAALPIAAPSTNDVVARSPEDINAILAALRAHPDIPLGRPLKVARGDLEARDFFSDFVQGFKEGFTGTIKTLGPLAVDLIKREATPEDIDAILAALRAHPDIPLGRPLKIARDDLEARDFLSDFVQGFKEGFTGTIETLGPLAVDLIKREASPEDIDAILAALRAHPDIPLGRPLKIARDNLEARDFFSDFVQGFKEGFTGTIKTLGPLAVDLIKKEDVELLARDFFSDFVQGFKEGFTGTIKTLGPLAVDLIKREASPEDIDAILAALRAHPDIPLGRPLKIARDDLEARDFFSDFVQGFKEGFTGTIKTLGPLAVDLIKKEDSELLARDFFSDFVQGFKEGFTGTIKTLGPLAVDLIKREASPEDIDAILAALRAHPDIPLGRPLKIARDDLEARDFLSDFVQGFKEGFTGTIKTLGPLAVDLIKKEDSELLARDFLSDFVQGFKEGFTGTIETLGPLAVDLIKKEDLEILAREFDSATLNNLD